MFPTLYKRTKSGAIEQWEVSVQGHQLEPDQAIIQTTYGHVGGAQQVTRDWIREGKNAGRSNQTTPLEQATKEAQARWTKQVKKGYVESLEQAGAGQNSLAGVAPMLAHKYRDHWQKVSFPCFVQPKLDGMRMVAICDQGKVELFTRNREPINSVPHIVDALQWITDGFGPLTLDGEIYHHDYRGPQFKELMKLVRPKSPVPGHQIVQYWVYDIISPTPQDLRLSLLTKLLLGVDKLAPIRLVEAYKVEEHSDITSWFRKFRQKGLEGAMVRSREGLYEHSRSYNLLKVKEFQDGEFEILNVVDGRGRMEGKAIFVCRAPGGTFQVKMQGSLADLADIYDHATEYIGRKLTVEYADMSADGIPRHPVGVRIREDC